MNIVFSANNMAEVMTLPIVPSEFNVSKPFANEEFETIAHGTLNLIGLKGLRSLSINSFFPNRLYSFAKNTKRAAECIAFFDKWAAKRVPIRIIVTDDKQKEILNMSCTIENFEHGIDRAGDVPYTLDLKEFVFVAVT